MPPTGLSSSVSPKRILVVDDEEQVAKATEIFKARERRNLPGLNPEKVEIILAGEIIYEAAMSQFEFTEVVRSNRGLCSGALLSPPATVARIRPSAWQTLPLQLLPEMGLQLTARPTTELHPT